jgi:hypothetical protein
MRKDLDCFYYQFLSIFSLDFHVSVGNFVPIGLQILIYTVPFCLLCNLNILSLIGLFKNVQHVTACSVLCLSQLSVLHSLFACQIVLI